MSLTKKAIGGSIHRIREFELEKVNLADEFDILQIVGEGWFGKILLTEHKSTQTEMALKALPKAYTAITDFFREFHYGLHLSAHRNIITSYDVAFETAGFYVFSQEYAPLGDLTANVSETGLGELHTKKVARQLAAAIHHIHSRELVHRDIKLDNVLVFKSDFSRIKLCDFGETRKFNTTVRRHNEWLPYSPPEILRINPDDTYKAIAAHDVWQFGIVIFVCLTGCLPWQKATIEDKRYTRYLNWHSATLNIAKKPKLFQLISSRAQRMFKRLLEPKLEKRIVNVLEVNKYVDDRWLGKLGAEKAISGGADERDELCPSMYSFHSSPEEKSQLLYTLTRYGIETNVDRLKKRDRIREWVQRSTIAEGNEEGDELSDDFKISMEPPNVKDMESMEGKHFPKIKSYVRKSTNSEELSSIEKIGLSRSDRFNEHDIYKQYSKSAPRPSIKNIERKNPFAPQVAQEIRTIAKYSIFPNGNPNLANSETLKLIEQHNKNVLLVTNSLEHKNLTGDSDKQNYGASPNTNFDNSYYSFANETRHTYGISLKAQDSIYSQHLPQSLLHKSKMNQKHRHGTSETNLASITTFNISPLAIQRFETMQNVDLTQLILQSSNTPALSGFTDQKYESEHVHIQNTIPSK